MPEGPQIKFALARGFAVSGLFREVIYPGRRAPRVALAPGYIYVAPLGL
jgi:hypothetical protein